MLHYDKEMLKKDRLIIALKERKRIEVLSLGYIWSEITQQACTRLLNDNDYLIKCINNWNYRIKIV